MDVAQRQIVGAALLHVLQGHGPVTAVPHTHLSVEQQDAGQPLVLRVKRTGKPGGSGGGGEGGSVYYAAVLREGEPLEPLLPEDVDVFRPQQPGIGAGGGVEVVVAGGDDGVAPEAGQRPGQLLRRLAVELVGVKEIPGQQQQLHAVVIGVVHQPVRQLAGFLTAQPGLLLRQGGKGAVQMEVRRV